MASQQPDPHTGGRPAVLAAVSALYHAPDTATRSAAGLWLEAWQAGPAAWSDADSLLHDGGTAMEARYLAAQTLRTKVARDYEDLPPTALPALRDSLASLAADAHARGEPPVRTQLCLALAALAAACPARVWPGGGPVQWAASAFGEGAPRACPPLLLELLTLLPEEATSYRPSLPPARRRALAAETDAAAPTALALLESCLSTASTTAPATRAHVLEAFAAWLRLGSGGGAAAAALAPSPLVAAALAGLSDVDAFTAAADAAAELVARCTEGGAPCPEAAPLAASVVPAVLALRPRFAVAAARAGAGGAAAAAASSRGAADYDDDDDAAAGMARLFAEVGEAYVEAIADTIGGAPPPRRRVRRRRVRRPRRPARRRRPPRRPGRLHVVHLLAPPGEVRVGGGGPPTPGRRGRVAVRRRARGRRPRRRRRPTLRATGAHRGGARCVAARRDSVEAG